MGKVSSNWFQQTDSSLEKRWLKDMKASSKLQELTVQASKGSQAEGPHGLKGLRVQGSKGLEGEALSDLRT